MNEFSGLMATYYDELFGTSDTEYAFYRSFLITDDLSLSKKKPPRDSYLDTFSGNKSLVESAGSIRALEIGSGTGQLLIKYVREGFAVDGVDNSQAMINECITKAESDGLDVTVYQQSMDALDLPQRYHTIYVPSCVIQLASDEAELRRIIHSISRHLVPGGRAVISLFMPLPDHTEESFYDKDCSKGKSDLFHVSVNGDRTLEVYCTRRTSHEDASSTYRFDVYQAGVLATQKSYNLRWQMYSLKLISKMLIDESLVAHTWYKDYQQEPLTLEACSSSLDKGNPVCVVVAKKV